MAEMENVRHIGWDDLNKTKYYFIGSLFWLSENVLLFPTVLIKTRLQVQQGKNLYNGTIDAAKKIYRFEGIRGLYKGFAFSNIHLVGGHVYLTTLEMTRAKVPVANESLKSLIAGLAAVSVSTTITIPVDVIAQKQMVSGQDVDASKVTTNSNYKSRSAWSVIMEINKTSGFKGFFKGYAPSMLFYGPHSAIWWSAYYQLNQFVGGLRPAGIPDLVIQGISGSAASVVTAGILNPIDVVRVRVQVDGGTIPYVFWTLYKQEGFLGFYKGLTARLANAIPTGFIVMSYEIIKLLSQKKT